MPLNLCHCRIWWVFITFYLHGYTLRHFSNIYMPREVLDVYCVCVNYWLKRKLLLLQIIIAPSLRKCIHACRCHPLPDYWQPEPVSCTGCNLSALYSVQPRSLSCLVPHSFYLTLLIDVIERPDKGIYICVYIDHLIIISSAHAEQKQHGNVGMWSQLILRLITRLT